MTRALLRSGFALIFLAFSAVAASAQTWDFEDESLGNWGAEVDANNGYDGTAEITSDRAYEGDYSALLTASGQFANAQLRNTVDLDMLNPGDILAFRVWVSADDLQYINGLQPLIQHGNDWGGWTDGWYGAGDLTADEWNTLEIVVPEPNDGVFQKFGIQITGHDAEDTPAIYVDNITLEEAEDSEPGELLATWDFEADLQDWDVTGGGTVEHSDERAYEGTYSAKITASDDSGETNFENETVSGITAGDEVIYRVWISADDLELIDAFQPFTRHGEEGDWASAWFGAENLAGGEWNYLTYEIPDNGEVASLGLQMYAGDNIDQTPSAFVDYITVTEGETDEIPEPDFAGHVTWDYETMTPEGWNTGGASADLETENVYSGKYAIAITAADDTGESFWQFDNPAEAGVEPQHTLHYRVWFSEESADQIEAFQVFFMQGEGWAWTAEWYALEEEDDDTGEVEVLLEPETWHTLTVQLPHEYTDDILQRIGIQMIQHNSADQPTILVDFITTDPDAPLHPHLDIPSGLSADNVNNFSLDLSWDASEGDDEVEEYIVYRGDSFAESLDDYVELTRTTDTEYHDSGLLHGTEYQYRVAAQSTDGLVTQASSPLTVETLAIEFDSHATWDFETGTPEGWDAAGGSAALENETVYSGMNAIALTATSNEPFWQFDNPAEAGVQPLHNIQYRVYISEEDLENIEFFQLFHQEGDGWAWHDTQFNPAEGELIADEWMTLTHALPEEFADDVLQRIGLKFDAAAGTEPTILIDFISTDPEAAVRPHLSIPANLSASAEAGHIALSWDASEGNDEVAEYIVYRGDDEAEDLADYEEIGRTSDTEFEDGTVVENTYRYRVSALSTEGNETAPTDYVQVTATSIDEELATPRQFALNNNYPNPFNPSTNIQFELPQSAHVTLQVFDVAGRLIQTLVNDERAAGTYNVRFDASNLASGVYMYRIQAGDFSQTRQMMLIK